MNPNGRQQLLTIVALICFGALVLDKVVVTPLWGLWEERAERISQLEELLDRGSVLIDREDVLRDRWADMKRDALPTNLSVAEEQVLKSVERWVQQSSLLLSSFNPEWRQNDEEQFAVYRCRSVGTGDLESVARFLFELERDPLALKIENLELSARDGQGKTLTLALTFSGLVITGEDK